MPAPTMQLREAPPEYPIEALKADCCDHNSKLISRCCPSGDDKLDTAAWEKTEEELSSEMILGLFFRPSRRPVSYCPFTSPVWFLGTARRRRESNCAVDRRRSGGRPEWCDWVPIHSSSDRFGLLGHSMPHGPRTFPTVCVV